MKHRQVFLQFKTNVKIAAIGACLVVSAILTDYLIADVFARARSVVVIVLGALGVLLVAAASLRQMVFSLRETFRSRGD